MGWEAMLQWMLLILFTAVVVGGVVIYGIQEYFKESKKAEEAWHEQHTESQLRIQKGW
jgi:membrane protein YqaA with SNARE-associated domain